MAAESYPVSTYSVSPAVASSSAGSAYGAHGARNAGYGAYGRSAYGDSGLYADRGYAARGAHNIGASRARDAYGAAASNYGKYRNVGAYAQDKVRHPLSFWLHSVILIICPSLINHLLNSHMTILKRIVW